MNFKVVNLERDMILKNKLIRRGQTVSVSQQDYQFLSVVYGMAVKGEKEYIVRTTKPVMISKTVEVKEETIVQQEVKPTKKRKKKKS